LTAKLVESPVRGKERTKTVLGNPVVQEMVVPVGGSLPKSVDTVRTSLVALLKGRYELLSVISNRQHTRTITETHLIVNDRTNSTAIYDKTQEECPTLNGINGSCTLFTSTIERSISEFDSTVHVVVSEQPL